MSGARQKSKSGQCNLEDAVINLEAIRENAKNALVEILSVRTGLTCFLKNLKLSFTEWRRCRKSIGHRPIFG